jgi:hypothetical protein
MIVKKVKIILSTLSLVIICAFLFCTIKNDNGEVAPISPIKPMQQNKPSVPPTLLVILDSTYVGIGETLNVTVWVRVHDTTGIPNAPVTCIVSTGQLSDDSATTDANGRAVFRYSGSKKKPGNDVCRLI